MGGRVEETGIKLRTSYSDTMLNYRLSKKFKLLRYGKFNYLTTYFYHTNIEILYFFYYFFQIIVTTIVVDFVLAWIVGEYHICKQTIMKNSFIPPWVKFWSISSYFNQFQLVILVHSDKILVCSSLLLNKCYW